MMMMIMKIKVFYYLKSWILRKNQNQEARETTTKKRYSKTFDGREMVVDGFISKIFPLQTTERTGMTARIVKVCDGSHL